MQHEVPHNTGRRQRRNVWKYLHNSGRPGDQMIQINVSVFYANVTGFMVIAWEEGGEKKGKKKHANTMVWEEMDNQKGFLLW